MGGRCKSLENHSIPSLHVRSWRARDTGLSKEICHSFGATPRTTTFVCLECMNNYLQANLFFQSLSVNVLLGTIAARFLLPITSFSSNSRKQSSSSEY